MRKIMRLLRFLSVCCILSFAVILSTVALSQDLTEWEKVIAEGDAAYGAEDFERAAELYVSTYELASTPVEKIISRYDHAYALAALDDLKAADAILSDAIQIARDEEIDYPELLLAVYELASDVALELGDKIRGLELGAKAVSLRPLDEDAWQRDDATDSVVHVPSGVRLELMAGQFRRGKLKTYREGGRDVSVGYNYFSDQGDMWITVYLTGTEIYGNSEGELHNRQGWFEASRDDIAQKYGNLDVAEDGIFSVSDRPDLKPLFTLYRAKYGDPPRDHMTGILVEQFDDFFVKIRVSYEADLGFDARVMLQEFIDAFDWPVFTPKILPIPFSPLLARDYPSCNGEKPTKTKSKRYTSLAIGTVALSLTYSVGFETGVPTPPETGQTCVLESFSANGIPVTAYWIRVPQPDQMLSYRFEIGGPLATGSITLSSSNTLSGILTELDAENDIRFYHLDYWNHEKVGLIEIYRGKPTYKKVKRLVSKVLAGKVTFAATVSRTEDGVTMKLSSDVLNSGKQ